MCTASWLITDNGYQLFFNRDERIGRTLAHPPEIITANTGVDYIMPIDPQGGGSWLAVNEAGLSVCLLNYYQGEVPAATLTSRGQLVTQLAGLTDSHSVFQYCKSLNMNQFAPFTLLVFEPGLGPGNNQVRAVRWDGYNLVDSLMLPPVISSAVDAETVQVTRRDLYYEYLAQHEPFAASLAFHHSHAPSKGHLSPCMHRDDAHTVSFSHIQVEKGRVALSYQPGAPCTGAPYHHQELVRRSACISA